MTKIENDNVSLKESKLLVKRDVFHRPAHPALTDRECGWIASWTLDYKDGYKNVRLATIEESFDSEEQAREASKVSKKQILKEMSGETFV